MQGIYLIGIGTFLSGLLIAYLYLSSKTVSQTEYEGLKQKNIRADYDLGVLTATEKELRINLDKLENTLSEEKEVNRSQETLITELRVNGRNYEEKVYSERLTNEKQQKNIEENNNQIRLLTSQLSEFRTLNANLQEKIANQNNEFEESRKKSLLEFENIANKLFEEKTTKFSKESKENIELLLNPLKENLKEFKKQVEETYDKESKQRFSLEGKIKELVDLNQQISKDATNLTKALKGQAKTQGYWGEMILENILEYSGLVKNREYFIQESFIDNDGKRKQPDVIIKYPDDRYIIVDSKVSLTAYERFANCEDIEEQKLYLAEHIKSIKSHIDNLSSKEYDKFDKTLDFVMLFVPIEPAFMTALHFDQELWSYAYKKRVLLISPTNLIAALKMVSDIWKRELQNKNSLEIAKRGEFLYEKFVGFVGDMEEIDKHLGKVSDKYNDAMNKLSKGSGNLIRQAEMLKKLGINSKKSLPEKYLLEEMEDENEDD
ncbi:DNA recombination protein RmuC [Arcticibacterium luteifluviistationis]|uniref:DNA recombination protein RmuC n=1 Tax=Arcticibacterium luteifluviistationis TaxID=1784714 RepID=A0A2Z4GD29_9BACT|nr:DNA recombination protein RmuC [Arcticibacterium luteifluviistationis]AWV99054.1 DNA recombination protein RmuC [Arcticibacterium luteifluviistationis]